MYIVHMLKNWIVNYYLSFKKKKMLQNTLPHPPPKVANYSTLSILLLVCVLLLVCAPTHTHTLMSVTCVGFMDVKRHSTEADWQLQEINRQVHNFLKHKLYVFTFSCLEYTWEPRNILCTIVNLNQINTVLYVIVYCCIFSFWCWIFSAVYLPWATAPGHVHYIQFILLYIYMYVIQNIQSNVILSLSLRRLVHSESSFHCLTVSWWSATCPSAKQRVASWSQKRHREKYNKLLL